MTKPSPTTHCERQPSDNFDQALNSMLMLNALRKPLKLTATLKRRALKKPSTAKSAIVDPSPESRT